MMKTVFVLVLLFVTHCLCQDTTTSTTTTTTTDIVTSTTTIMTSTSQAPNTTKDPHGCGNKPNVTCAECLKNVECFFCNSDQKCKYYKASGIFPDGCSASEARWFDCSVNLQAILISVGAIGSVIVLIAGCCVCYCCSKTCKAVSDRSLKRMERKIMQQRENVRTANAEKRQERQSKNEAIRVKYGLKPSTYTQMD